MKCWPWAHRWENWYDIRIVKVFSDEIDPSLIVEWRKLDPTAAPKQTTLVEQRSDCELCGMTRLRSVKA